MTDLDRFGSAPPPRRGRSIVVVFAALSALSVAGVVIWGSVGGLAGLTPAAPILAQAPGNDRRPADPVGRGGAVATPEAGSPGRPIGDDEPAYWSEVAVYKAGPRRPRPVVVMRRGKQPDAKDEHGLYQGLLARELVRQGFLLAAREEFGAVTRDVPIGDPDLPGTPDATLRIGSRFRTKYYPDPADPAVGRVTVVAGDGAGRRVVWSREFECDMIVAPQFGRLTAQVEVFSRHGFRAALEGAGLARAAPAPAPVGAADGGLPEGVERRLGRPVETEQFAAIRALHDAIRAKGETSALLIALAKAYANLGTLAECQWTADYLAFQARGLLYAQRAVVRDRNAPASLRGQAYVEALAGLFRSAVADLDLADKADGGKDLPYWVAMVRAYTATDAPALERIARDHPDDPWPAYLRFLAVSQSSSYFGQEDRTCRHEILAAGRPILEAVPDCYRVIDGLVAMSGVANLHTATAVGYELYPKAMPERVAAVPGLPKSVVAPAPVAGEPAEVVLRRKLDAAAAEDPSGLTWGVLARQLREVRFLQVGRRLQFIAYQLAAPADEFAAEALPLVADHPNRGYVASFAGRYDGPEALKALRALDLADLELKADSVAYRFAALDPPTYRRLQGLAWEHVVLGTVPGQIASVIRVAESGRGNEAHNLLKYHPGSPLGRGVLIETRWDEAKPNAEAWAKDHSGADTLVIARLGSQALKEERLDDAERLFKEALGRSPEGWVFQGLAGVYVRRGDLDGYAEAATEFLKTDDLSLDHARVAGDLAELLMGLGKYAKARPFAEISAGSWACWAMQGAARCAEGMKDWEGAEIWVARTSERYAPNWLDWSAWCQRTGHGDARAAAQLVADQLAQGRPVDAVKERFPVAVALLAGGQPKPARELLEPFYRRSHDTADGALLALACDQDADAKARDAVMKEVADDPKPSGPATARLIGALGTWLAKGDKSPPDLARIAALFDEVEPARRANSAVLVGLFLDRHGEHDAALPYLKQSDTDKAYVWLRYLARGALRARGESLDPIPAP